MSDSLQNKLMCSVCGDELRPADKFCSGCGAAVKQVEKKSNVDGSDSLKNKSIKIKSAGIKKSAEHNYKIEKASKSKTISYIKIIYLLAALIGVTVIIIYASGVFEKPSASSNSNLNNTDEVHKGADLQHLQQINLLEETVKNNPNDKRSLLELAHLLNDSGFKDRAVEKYKMYLRLDSQNADVLVDMGVCYYELGKYDDAIKQMNEALKYQPQHQIAHLNLGIVNLTAGNHDEAVNWWKKAVEINPSTDIAKRAQELINSH